MKCQEIIEKLEAYYPLAYACEWDNPGLMAGERSQEIETVFVALDATDEVIEEAIQAGADLLLTHHPLIFGGIRSVTGDDLTGRKLMRLIQNHMCCYAMHTNYDVMGMAALAASKLGLREAHVLEEVHEGEGIGRVGLLPRTMTLQECCQLVKEAFQIPNVKVFGDLRQSVTKAALSPGAGKSMAKPALAAGADVLITGDIDHHTGIDMKDLGMAVIDAGHYGIEHIYIEDIRQLLTEAFPRLSIYTAGISHPFKVV